MRLAVISVALMEIIIRQENAAYSVVIKWRWHSSGPWGRERRRLEVNTYPQTHTYIVQREEKLLWWAAIHPLPQYWQELTLAHTHTTEQNASSLITSLCVNRLTYRLDSWVWFLALVTVKIEAFRIPIVTGQNYLDSSWACACIHACMSVWYRCTCNMVWQSCRPRTPALSCRLP